ncbi:MAG: hypothetical protein ACLPQL_02410, partial [Desulfobaccales bacterium]
SCIFRTLNEICIKNILSEKSGEKKQPTVDLAATAKIFGGREQQCPAEILHKDWRLKIEKFSRKP